MRPKAVLSGSFHRSPDKLRRLFRELEATGCRILSPITLDFMNPAEPVLKTENEQELSANELELFHLRAIRDSDFILLHAPGGYVSTSASYELGYAAALKIPCFCFERPDDERLAVEIKKVSSVFEVLEQLNLTAF